MLKHHFAVDIVLVVNQNNSGVPWDGVETIMGKKVGWIERYFYHEQLPLSIVDSINI